MQYKDLEKIYWNMAEEHTEDNAEENGVFDTYYLHFQETFMKGLEVTGREKKIEIPEFSQNFMAFFRGQLQRISMRTLILEMGLCAECGELSGKDSHEQYLHYANVLLRSPDFLKEIYEEYPFMYKDLLRVVLNLIQNVGELLERFASDRNDINFLFYPDNPCNQIMRINCSGSDSHRGGHKVYILELDNGERMVYKTRNLAVDEAYLRFLKWVFLNIRMHLWWNGIINRGEYGWCQWVSAQNCSSYEELRRYYKRNGILLCVSYLLGSEDMHYENLIAHGEYPVIVDLEMVIGSRGIEKGEELTEIEKIYRESVYHTGILPLYAWNETGEGINVGAINGEGGQMVPFVMPVAAEVGTVNMHIEYRRPQMTEGKNLALLDGNFIEPYQFIDDILEGFEETYHLLMGKRGQAAEILGEFHGVTVRHLVRNTQQYIMLLMTLGHPNYLTKDRCLDGLWEALDGKGKKRRRTDSWLFEQEMSELLQGDIPYFYANVSRCELYSGCGECLSGYFPYPVMDSVESRLRKLCESDLHLQKKLIRTTLLPGKKKTAGQRFDRLICGADGLMAAKRIGDILLEEAVWSKDRKELGWIGVTVTGYRERSYLIRPMNDYLYEGLSGMALFFAELETKTNQQEYSEAKAALVNMLFKHTDEIYAKRTTERLPTGAYTGEASIAFAYMLLYSGHPDSVYLTYMEKQCRITAKFLADDGNYDILGGNAGAIMVFLNAYVMTGQEKYLAWAREAGDCLLKSADLFPWGIGWINPGTEKALTGFAHGNAGIMFSLARLGHESQDDKYMEAAYQAYRYEEHYYRKERMDWADLRNPENAAGDDHEMAWCHGWGGIVMARVLSAKYAKGQLKKELERTKTWIRQKKEFSYTGDKMCLCHGKGGNAALFAFMGKEKEASSLQMQIDSMLCGEVDPRDGLDMQECSNYGLLGGIAGIGYGCLCGYDKVMKILSVGDCLQEERRNFMV